MHATAGGIGNGFIGFAAYWLVGDPALNHQARSRAAVRIDLAQSAGKRSAVKLLIPFFRWKLFRSD